MEGNIYQMGQVIGAGLAMMGAIGAGAGIGIVVWMELLCVLLVCKALVVAQSFMLILKEDTAILII